MRCLEHRLNILGIIGNPATREEGGVQASSGTAEGKSQPEAPDAARVGFLRAFQFFLQAAALREYREQGQPLPAAAGVSAPVPRGLQ